MSNIEMNNIDEEHFQPAVPEPAEAHLAQQGIQPSYSMELPLDSIHHGIYGSMMNTLGNIFGTLGAIPCCVCFPNPYKRIYQGEVGLITRFGKFYKCVDPGLVQ
ncbi:hypothetical protein BZG36_04783, partial [Bifiguratus adelaidae]